ncbi:protein spaetzle [Parasteatoda tepidariorum]|nr:protein spaetzle [Parasteatoda tepidariorum]
MAFKWHRAITNCFLVLFLILSLKFSWKFLVSGTSQNKSERTVIFPTSNSTEHSLPVFPDLVVEYVGRQRPMAPSVDIYGTPLCVKKQKDTYCENIENYPESEIRSAITYSKDEFQELFGTMTMSARRIPGEIYEDPVCPQYSRFFFPKAAVNENDQWAFVVNDVDDYVQAVMSEMCEQEDTPCRYLDGVLPFEHSSRCRQKYAYKRLLALHPNQKKTYTDAFRFPSCCVCYVKKPSLSARKHEIPVEDMYPISPTDVRRQKERTNMK